MCIIRNCRVKKYVGWMRQCVRKNAKWQKKREENGKLHSPITHSATRVAQARPSWHLNKPNHGSSPLVSPPYRLLPSSLANGGTLKPRCGTWVLDITALELYSPGLGLFDCKACLVIVIPEPILNSLMSSPGPPVVSDGDDDAPREGIESPKPLPALTSGEYGLFVDGENDETWSNMTLSWVAFMRRIMFARRSGGKGLSAP